MDALSISSWLAFWVVITLAGYWLVTRVARMRAERKGSHASQAEVPAHRGHRVSARVPRDRSTEQAEVGNPLAGQSAREGFTRFSHLSPFRANPR